MSAQYNHKCNSRSSLSSSLSLDIKTKVKQKLPPFVGAKSRTAGSVDAETGARRVNEGLRGGEQGANGEADGCGEARASGWRFPMTEDDNNRSSVFFHFALLSYY